MTLTRTFGARSAARATAKPSSPDFAAEIAQWLEDPFPQPQKTRKQSNRQVVAVMPVR